MKFLSNTYDPKLPDAPMQLLCRDGETRQAAWANHLFWLQDKVIGVPQATSYYTVEQLKAMNMVGVYSTKEH